MKKSWILFFSLFIFFISSPFLNLAAIEQKEFIFSKEPIDVVIPSTEKDQETLDLCINGIKENCTDVRRIIVISKTKLTNNAEWIDESSFPITKDMIAFELFGNETMANAYKMNPSNRLGWIYQQFLKLYAPLVIENISPNVLVLDSDTIFLRPVSFIGPNGAACFNPGTERHSPYFAHMHRLLPELHRVYPEHSGISHHMLFQKCVLEDLKSAIETYHQKPMWKALIHCIDHNCLFGSCMSEYEIYFNYALLRSKQFSIRKFTWQNISSISSIPNYKKQ